MHNCGMTARLALGMACVLLAGGTSAVVLRTPGWVPGASASRRDASRGGVLVAAMRLASPMKLRGGGDAIDVTGDGGVLKQVLLDGTGDELPLKNDDVCVHYVGTLQSDGSKFDSSRDRSAPFTFKLGQGKVIKGWDEGVATMKRGEKAVFTVRSDYGYGVDGSGDKIPSNATLVFEIELLRWNEREVTTDGGVFLKPLDQKGTGWRHPDRNDEVMVKYEGRVNGAVFTSSTNNDFEVIFSSSISRVDRIPFDNLRPSCDLLCSSPPLFLLFLFLPLLPNPPLILDCVCFSARQTGHSHLSPPTRRRACHLQGDEKGQQRINNLQIRIRLRRDGSARQSALQCDG